MKLTMQHLFTWGHALQLYPKKGEPVEEFADRLLGHWELSEYWTKEEKDVIGQMRSAWRTQRERWEVDQEKSGGNE